MPTETHIGTLRMRGAERDTPALRLAVSSQVGGADLRPRGAPPASILVVRRLADPLPGRLGLARGPWPDPEWEQAARERLAALYRQAVRPWRGRIAFGAEAVLFQDEAERLACLALDLARGGGGERWCWRGVLRETRAADLPSLLAGQARDLPAVFTLLARWGEAAAVAGALGEAGAARVADALVEAHGLPSGLLLSRLAVDHGEESSPSPPAPWHRQLPPSPLLSRAREHLLGLALMRQDSPARVRSARFAFEARRWWRSSPNSASGPMEVEERAQASETSHREIPLLQERGRGEVAGGQGAARATGGEHAPLLRRSVAGGEAEAARAKRPNPGAGERSGPVPAAAEEEHGPPTAPILHEVAPEPWAPPEEGFPTRLGGVLYLINLIEHLGLLDRFEEEEPALAEWVGAWGFLEMLARALLGSLAEEHADDLLWAALAELDGRAPADWLAGDLSPWLTSILPGIQGRLEDALGVEPAEVAETLLACPGRIWITSSHVDLVAGLDRISLPARRAGLDRDPGWRPRFGRVVLFHFE